MAKKPTKYTVTDGKMFLMLQVGKRRWLTVTSPFIPGMVAKARTLEQAFEKARSVEESLKSNGTGVRKEARTSAKPVRRSVKKAK